MSRRPGFLLVLVWGVILSGSSSFARDSEERRRNEQPRIESLAFDANGRHVVIEVKTSAQMGEFVCRLPSLEQRDLILEMPGVKSDLQNRYALESRMVPEVRVENQLENGSGVRLIFALDQAFLSSIEQVEDGLVLSFDGFASADADDDVETIDYQVGPADKLEISVFDHPDLSKKVEVRGDGTINLPLIGDVMVAGKTVAQVDEELTRMLGEDFLVDPQVAVAVTKFQSQWVSIIGEIRKPGRYFLKHDMRVIDLLAEAGGATKEAGSEIFVTRSGGGQQPPRQFEVDLGTLLSRNNSSANIRLRHHDIITIAKSEHFYIRGEVFRPGAYVMEKGMSILKAISIAGGFGQFANRKHVELLRARKNGAHVKIEVNVKDIERGKKEDVAVRADDIIIVPRRIF